MPRGSSRPAPGRFWSRIGDYYALTKPGIVALMLITTLAGMWMAAGGPPPFSAAFWTLLGVALAAGSGNAINCYVDRDIDAQMKRTQNRPLPAGRLSPRQALIFGVAAGILGVALLWWRVNPLSAALGAFGNLFYVFVYTLWLKRRTPQNIVIGGAAGSVPPMVGWAAITGQIELPAVLLFLVIFLWTPPHFWALSLYRSEDYRRVGVPMMPIVRGAEETRRQIFIYSVVLVAVTFLFYPVGAVGVWYLAAAAIAGARLLWLAALTLREKEFTAARRLFIYSNIYLAVVFWAAVIDVRF